MDWGKESARQTLAARGVRFVHLQFTDISGAIKGVTLPLAELEQALERGVWFDGSAIEGFARVSESDMWLRPDLDALLVVYNINDIAEARLVCDVMTPFGELYGGAPRTALRQVMDEAAELGYDYRVGIEFEFSARASESRMAGLSLAYKVAEVQRHLLTIMAESGVLAEAREGSLDEGRYGIYVWPIDALRAADAVTTLRYALTPLARQHGLQISIMPQASTEGGSLELRVHQTLVDRETGQNVLVEPAGELAPTASSPLHRFIGGQLRHAAAMTAVLAPRVNAYKRSDAAWRIGWGRQNRYTILRVARTATPDRNRVVARGADPSCNPYLALATLLACGSDGLRDGRYVVDAVDESKPDSANARQHLDALPDSLREALDALAGDGVVRGALGPVISERFLAAGGQQWATYRREVTAWERQRYVG